MSTSTLRGHVEALGGHLEVAAVFAEQSLSAHGPDPGALGRGVARRWGRLSGVLPAVGVLLQEGRGVSQGHPLRDARPGPW